MGKHDLAYFEDKLKDFQEKAYKKAPGIKAAHRQAFVEACEVFHDGYESIKKAKTDAELEKCMKKQAKAMKGCVKTGSKIIPNLDLTGSNTLETALLKGVMIQQATPQGLSDWVAEDAKNDLYLQQMFSSTDMLKFMLTHGGPKDGKWGSAIEIYFKLSTGLSDDADDLTKVNRKIAMAVALELASPIYEFDTKIKVDPIKRYHHYADAYKNGELDPAFPYFSVWELRHVVNCDAPDEQLTWGREMLMNYAPYMSTLTDVNLRYNYILETDVLMRNPVWTGSPRTYQQVLSGGGKDKPNAWFGRFICKAFGIPTWGCSQEKLESFTRWTPSGWVPVKGASWELCSYGGRSGIDFKGEADARSAYSAEEYYMKLILLEALADVMDSRKGRDNEEKNVIHPMKLWRSLLVIQKALMLEAVTPESFERSGDWGVKTKVEKYLDIFQADKDDTKITVTKGRKITVPAAAHGFSSGNKMVIASMDGGKQLNFLADGIAEYELPDDIDSGTYSLTIDVCTVHLKQAPVVLTVNDGEEFLIKIPYTMGEWKTTEGVQVELSGGDILRIARSRPCLGIAIRRIVLKA